MKRNQIIDSFGRVHTNLRVSVTDRCNIRCFYCMPDENIQFLPRKQILSFEEITQFVRISARLGVNKIRITGGEPLVRSELPELVRMISEIEGITDVALTTNGILLERFARELKAAGLNRLNISLDTLNEEIFERISRRKGLEKVIQGIEAAIAEDFDLIRLNAIAIKNLTEVEILPLAMFARRLGLELRFIEFMPLDAEQNWDSNQVLTGNEIQKIIESGIGPLSVANRSDSSQPATDFEYLDGGGKIGFINPVSQPFCKTCNRLRLTAEGMVRNCLFSTVEWDARKLIRSGADDSEIEQLILDCVQNKKAAHGIDSNDFARPQKSMYQIGG